MSEIAWESRPWGGFSTVYSDKYTTVKVLRINPQSSLSLQYHEFREEYWTLLGNPHFSNRPNAVINGKMLTMVPGERYHVGQNVLHRLSNPGSSPVEILEIAVGHFDETDIIRIHDQYGRA